jgi:hypothetical protein
MKGRRHLWPAGREFPACRFEPEPDFTSWTSANNITINGAPVTSNNIMIDGIAQRDEMDERVRQSNIDAHRRGAGGRERLHGGERPQQRRSGELRHQVWDQPLCGSGGTAKRDAWVSNDYVRERTTRRSRSIA